MWFTRYVREKDDSEANTQPFERHESSFQGSLLDHWTWKIVQSEPWNSQGKEPLWSTLQIMKLPFGQDIGATTPRYAGRALHKLTEWCSHQWHHEFVHLSQLSPGGSAGKESTCNAGDLGSIPGLRRSPGEGNNYPLQHSGLENPRDYTVHGVAKSQTWGSDFHSFPVVDNKEPSGKGTFFEFTQRYHMVSQRPFSFHPQLCPDLKFGFSNDGF